MQEELRAILAKYPEIKSITVELGQLIVTRDNVKQVTVGKEHPFEDVDKTMAEAMKIASVAPKQGLTMR